MHIAPDDIAKLIDDCKNDDRKAQELFYRSFYKTMMGLCMRYTRNEDDAKLVLNSGFLKVFKNIRQFDPAKASLYTWVRTIIVNCCLDHIKSIQRTIAANELHEAETIHIEPEVNTRLKAEEILHLVGKLPPATKAIFNLYVVEGYNHKEIGAMLQISEGTSKWHLSEARKNLKQQLQNRIYSE